MISVVSGMIDEYGSATTVVDNAGPKQNDCVVKPAEAVERIRTCLLPDLQLTQEATRRLTAAKSAKHSGTKLCKADMTYSLYMHRHFCPIRTWLVLLDSEGPPRSCV